MNIYILIISFYLLLSGCLSTLFATEAWVDYNSISKIELGANKEDVISDLGEPILILGSSEFDHTISLFYNYHVKSYDIIKGGSPDDKIRNIDKERLTLLKFTFEDDQLVSWEEDKITLSMSPIKRGVTNSSLFQYFSLLLNLILFIKII